MPSVTVHRWLEADGETTWRCVSADGSCGALTHGDPPELGVELAEGTVTEIVERMDVVAGDLQEREAFDRRRVYETKAGTRVVFKRTESGGVVLWSYKINAEIKVGSTTSLFRTDDVAEPTAVSKRRMTQKMLTAWIISQTPDITPEALIAELKAAFPTARIGERHGPHYISLSKTGRLPEPPDSDPRTWEVSNTEEPSDSQTS